MNVFNDYQSILAAGINAGYVFRGFTEISKTKKTIILRHDVDTSLISALQIAKIEFKNNIKSTFFVMLRSPFYNLFSRSNNEIVKKILTLGHDIGLHYDEGYYPEKDNLQTLISKEVDILESNFNTKVKVVSFHQPSKKILRDEIQIKQINTYDTKFFKDIKYISDSNMQFHEDPIELVNSDKFRVIQILTHPIWWVNKGGNTIEKFKSVIKENFYKEQNQIFSTESAYGDKKEISIN